MEVWDEEGGQDVMQSKVEHWGVKQGLVGQGKDSGGRGVCEECHVEYGGINGCGIWGGEAVRDGSERIRGGEEAAF